MGAETYRNFIGAEFVFVCLFPVDRTHPRSPTPAGRPELSFGSASALEGTERRQPWNTRTLAGQETVRRNEQRFSRSPPPRPPLRPSCPPLPPSLPASMHPPPLPPRHPLPPCPCPVHLDSDPTCVLVPSGDIHSPTHSLPSFGDITSHSLFSSTTHL